MTNDPGASSLAQCSRPSGGTEWRLRTPITIRGKMARSRTTEPSLRVTVGAETSASPEQVLAAARDFSAHRAQIWPNVETKRLEVHERGDTWAEVTEGTMIL